jgi:hypothetical protein
MKKRGRPRSAARIGARESGVRRCPACGGAPLRQVGDPRGDARGWEYRRRSCDSCDWQGVELRAIVDPRLAEIIEELVAGDAAAAQEAERRDLLQVMEGQ